MLEFERLLYIGSLKLVLRYWMKAGVSGSVEALCFSTVCLASALLFQGKYRLTIRCRVASASHWALDYCFPTFENKKNDWHTVTKGSNLANLADRSA